MHCFSPPVILEGFFYCVFILKRSFGPVLKKILVVELDACRAMRFFSGWCFHMDVPVTCQAQQASPSKQPRGLKKKKQAVMRILAGK